MTAIELKALVIFHGPAKPLADPFNKSVEEGKAKGARDAGAAKNYEISLFMRLKNFDRN
jgi:hypothetical protein